jgi:hypothetical protein
MAAAMRRQVRMADCEDASVDAVQAPGGDGSVDGAVGIPKLSQLPPCDDPVLSIGNGRQSVMRSHFPLHTE